MAAISGVGRVRDGALISYAATGGEREGVVVDQSDPTVWVHDGNSGLLTLTVRPVDEPEPVDVSGSRVREVVADPDEHDHAMSVDADPADGTADAADADAPSAVGPSDASDVTAFVERHGRDEFVITYTDGGEQREVTATVTDILGVLVAAVTEDGDELGVPYAALDRIELPEDA